LQPTVDIFGQQSKFRLKTIFAPEHGLYGASQDQKKTNDFYDKTRKVWVHSIYGKRIIPDANLLKKLDCIVIDLQDIGTRYYTFLWSAILLIRQIAKLKKKVIILDRPNPLNGVTIEGPVLEPTYSSFVGLYPIPVRHGLTIGELCTFLNFEHGMSAEIEIIKMKGWQRRYYFRDTGLYWTVPSPNMPLFNTALVYPGMCLLEGTNVSEGRGTTRPFETFGAPWIDPFCLVERLKKEKIPYVDFQPVYFIPTFHKYKNRKCGGVQIHVSNIQKFKPVLTGLSIIKIIKELYPNKFQWRNPPYEFEKTKMPFDILIGNFWIRKAIEKKESIIKIERRWQNGLIRFNKIRKKYLIYK
jgi:uncharacterized protein YbbC (DUF1343 family)